MSGSTKPSSTRPKGKGSVKLKEPSASAYCHSPNSGDSVDTHSTYSSNSTSSSIIIKPKSVVGTVSMDLKKEYCRYCKLYSSEPLDLVSAPLEQATLCQGPGKISGVGGVSINLKGRGLRGVDCIALGKILASNANIQHMDLSDCLLLPQGFQALLDGVCKNTNLEILELRGNNIQSADMLEPLGSMLKVNSSLQRLVLEWNHIGCNRQAFRSFCDGLSVNTGLQCLDLRNNQVSDECTLDLAGALKHNKTLKDVDLRWNSVGVKGARAFYDLLNLNTTLLQVQLGGNFVPEEVVQHIETMLKQRSEQEELVKDYSTRTTILTRQLQKTEEEYQHEIKNIMSVFDAEEKEYRRLIEEDQNRINQLSQERNEEITRNSALQHEVNSLKKKLEEATAEETKLRRIIKVREERISEVESAFKSQSSNLELGFEKKIKDLQVLSDALAQEKTSMMTKLKTTEAELQVKCGEVLQLKETINALHKTSEQLQLQFDEKLRQAKESWAGFQTEVESTERKEIKRLESQMAEMNSSLMEHLRLLENKKADAEEEVRRMKILLVTSKSETEEELTKLRVNLAEEHNNSVKSHMDQIHNLRKENETLEVEVHKLEGHIRKLEVDNGKLTRQNEHLKQQLAQINEDLNEVHATTQTTVNRTKNELKDTLESLAKEEECNKILRTELNEIQQQVASLSVKVSKLTQEKQADMEFWKLQIQRREEELHRIKSEDMRRAALLHEAFSVYMRSTAAATGLPIPSHCFQQEPSHANSNSGQNVNQSMNLNADQVNENQAS